MLEIQLHSDNLLIYILSKRLKIIIFVHEQVYRSINNNILSTFLCADLLDEFGKACIVSRTDKLPSLLDNFPTSAGQSSMFMSSSPLLLVHSAVCIQILLVGKECNAI